MDGPRRWLNSMQRSRLMLVVRLAGLLVVVVTTTISAATAPPRLEVLEEIESFPDTLLGEWVVGGRAYIADESTTFELDHPATVGLLAEVEYVMRDGVAVALQIEPRAMRAIDISDGPYCFWPTADSVKIVALCRGRVVRASRDGVSGVLHVEPLCGAGPSLRLDAAPPAPPPSTWDEPSRVLAISDVEGNHRNLRRFLESNTVIDDDGRWSFGDGHLVFVGDIVDRGDEVTEVLWLIRRLEHEAREAGGRVHYVLGNHEAMIMAGDLRYVNAKYGLVAGRLGMTYDELFGPSSELGRWLRTRNAVVRVGDLLFVHGGYSPRLDAAGLDLDALNQRVRDGIGRSGRAVAHEPAEDPVRHRHGPLWYRGYFEEHAESLGGRPTDAQVDAILSRHGARHIVVGHCVVDEIRMLDAGGRLIGIDVRWKDAQSAQGLLHEDGVLWRLDLSGRRERLAPRRPTIRPTP
jgi:hypothetical protein